MGIPVTKATLNAAGDTSWQAMRSRRAEEWQHLPGTGKEKALQIVEWLHHPQVEALAAWLAEQRINGF